MMHLRTYSVLKHLHDRSEHGKTNRIFPLITVFNRFLKYKFRPSFMESSSIPLPFDAKAQSLLI